MPETLTDHICPVCGFSLRKPPEDHTICPCCGTHFDYDDAAPTQEATENRRAELRFRWFVAGTPWRSRIIDPPRGWDPIEQIKRLNIFVPRAAPVAMSVGAPVVRRDVSVLRTALLPA